LSFHSLEHKLIDFFKEHYAQESRNYVVFCSGGLDSLVLLNILKNIKPIFKFDLSAFYIHHGSSEEKCEQSLYRDKSLEFVKEYCSVNSVPFLFKKSDVFLQSEEECRNFRIGLYKEELKKKSRVFLAQHKDDFFETLVMRLIRGTGAEGFSEPFSKDYERPFLRLCTKNELNEYAINIGLSFFEDPSNLNQDHLRNWLRHNWLKALEASPNGLEPFKRSLINLSDYMSQAGSDFENLVVFDGNNKGFLDLSNFIDMTQVQKKGLVSHILHHIKKSGYTTGQVLEVVRLLEQKKEDFEFKVSSIQWSKSQTKVCFKVIKN